MSDTTKPKDGAWSHKMTDEERREAIEEALNRMKPLFRLTEGQLAHIGRVERERRIANAKSRHS